MGVYDDAIATAKRMIAAKGQLATWRKFDTGLFQQSSANHPSPVPWLPTSARGEQDFSVSIVFLPISRVNSQLIRALSGTEVTGPSKANLQGLMASVDFEPSDKDIVIRDERQLNIASIDPIAPDGTPILYVIEFLS